ncbi:lantibiotic dehydratase [Corynebacterium kozikiae]|uniref:lantibiotic dehydratase n=1 Tax=Corynebacterium kozikiae TaxID=2968469 RepID=UPI00211B8B64|nr:lantibiotic dehydratase [Corynebacterium sp. 76QC2CO]MCQ9344098.1 lantibiotic dehydratase [Corynebacterium sp. 76QC2CO]
MIATVTETHGNPIIRAASTCIDVLNTATKASSLDELVTLIEQEELLQIELKLFHPEVLRQVEVISAGIEQRPKIARKTIRALTRLIARATSRATPSRLMGSVGNISLTSDPDSLALENIVEITASRRNVRVSDAGTPYDFLRWNPSIVVFGSRFYVTAPRKSTVDPLSSVGTNPLLSLVRTLSMHPVSRELLISHITATYADVSRQVVEEIIYQLVDKEILLTENDESYYSFRNSRQSVRTEIDLSNPIVPNLEDPSILDVDMYRHAQGQLPGEMHETIISYLNHGLSHGIFEYNDSGIGQVFAELLLEKYGAARIPVARLIHPTEGLPWSRIRRAQGTISTTVTAYHRAVYSAGMDSKSGWIDLRELGEELPRTDRRYRNFDSVDIIASVHGDKSNPLYSMADAISNISAGVTTARFDHLNGEAVPDQDGVDIDWVSPQQAFNSVREHHESFSRRLNVNCFEHNASELTVDDLQVWTDGISVHVCDTKGSPVIFRPTSMAGLGCLPEWLMQIAISGTAFTPNINWSWSGIENSVDYLPGVVYGELIVSRPARRYTGDVDFEKFNSWADRHNIPAWIRIGAADKKILLNRTASIFKEVLQSELHRGDGWIYYTFEGELSPYSIDSTGKRYFVEVSQSYRVEAFRTPSSQLNDVAAKLPVVSAHHDKELVPASSEYVNLIIVPREGNYDRVLESLFLESRPDHEMYFVRYPHSSGGMSIRLRFRRNTDENYGLHQAIRELAANGTLLDIVEEPHSFEYERYGGKESFCLFKLLATLESKLVIELNSSSTGPHTHRDFGLLDWWLDLFPDNRREVIAFAISSGSQTGESIKQASRIARESRAMTRPSIPDSIHSEIRAVAHEISRAPINTYQLQSAAHLFCNRIGISTQREIVLWIALSKTEGMKHHDNDTLD